MCVGKLGIDVAALRDAMHCERNFHFRAMCAVLYGDAFVDASILSTHMAGTAHGPFQFVGIKAVKLRLNGALSSVTGDKRKSEHEYVFFEVLACPNERQPPLRTDDPIVFSCCEAIFELECFCSTLVHVSTREVKKHLWSQ